MPGEVIAPEVPAPTLSQIRMWGATCSVADAAAALGISKSTVYDWVRAGVCPVKVIAVRGCRRVVTASLIRLLDDVGGDGDA